MPVPNLMRSPGRNSPLTTTGTRSRPRTGPRSGRRVLAEDPPDLADYLGMILAQVAGHDDLLGNDARHVGAVVGHETVRSPAGVPGWIAMMEWTFTAGAGDRSPRPVRIGDPHSSS